MGIINTIIRSRDDLVKPKKKSYWGYKLHIELLDREQITKKVSLLPTEQRLVSYELSDIEPSKQYILLGNSKKSLGRLTTSQIKEMLDDMGFNVDTILSGSHLSDIAAVLNINGFVIPGWMQFIRFLSHFSPDMEKLFLTKLAPGRKRLHIRLYEMNDGTWVILAHTDWNWMSLNLARTFHAHVIKGTGDYQTGTKMMYALLEAFKTHLDQNKILSYREISRIITSS